MLIRVLCLAATATSVSFLADARPAHIKPFSITVSHIQSEDATLPGGNELARQSTNLELSAGARFSQNWVAGISVGADWLDYSTRTPLAYSMGWDEIQRYHAGVFVRYQANEHWSFMAAPKLQYAWADGANRSDAISYGVVMSGMYRFDSGNTLGLGVAYLNDIEEVRTIPYLAIDWKLTERWSIANPFQAGFSGPAGLELRYDLSDEWQFGLGNSRRTTRFLTTLEGEEAAELEEWVGFGRATWQMNDAMTLSALAGFYFDSELEVGRVKQELDSQAAVALAVKFAF
ncbi:DUF6268 family outer membrane beta-barrel protein [Shewanella submarina]|uniref:DUF6268 family outer membrane beta-barrel protein n=1 Tax=Shewanella submarina TaxID=2016376 RepID=A0ABV7GGS5_9GAMM|nr:DUF6268 family outer membrane beta-barrel protein [Shewanella submarina]MCL1036420.1 DUF6268 family outer membrane beta-barrel protein [Shewanella submarina]